MTKLVKTLLSLLLVVSLVGCGTSSKQEETTTDTPTTDTTGDDTKEESIEDTTSSNEEKKKETTQETKQEVVNINIESDSIVNGKWITAISSTSAKTPGLNQSPGILFDSVDNASSYCIYMIDTTASNWLHWRATGLTEVFYSLGANPGKYVGPYPPSGTHTYEVHVFALLKDPDTIPGNMDSKNSSITSIQSTLDISGGSKGNVIGHGKISATVTSGDQVVE